MINIYVLCYDKTLPFFNKCRITVDLIDKTSTISVVIFGSDAEKILGVNAVDLMSETTQVRLLKNIEFCYNFYNKLFLTSASTGC